MLRLHTRLKSNFHGVARTAVAAVLGVLVSNVPAVAQGPDHAEVLVGEVTVETLPEGRVAVVLNRFDIRDPDDTAERVFVLQTTTPVAAELPLRMAAARVIVKADRLLAVSLEEPHAVGLFLSDVERSAVRESLESMLDERYGQIDQGAILLHAGHGFARHWGEFDLPIEAWPPARPGTALVPKGVEGEALCHAGGEGSVSCSIECVVGGCGVTCQSGYYACCKCVWTPSCTCVEDGGSNECPPFPCVE